jgi:type III secretion protein R
VATALALVLSLVVMAPLWQEVDQRVAELDQGGWSALWSAEPQRAWTTASEVARRPLLAFLRRNASSENVRFFEELHRQRSPDTLPLGAEFLILAPAFVVTELSEGFLIGFLLFLPFLVVDLFVANLLLALGLQMVSPATVSLPLKLLLFVLADGWALLCQGLVTGYQ